MQVQRNYRRQPGIAPRAAAHLRSPARVAIAALAALAVTTAGGAYAATTQFANRTVGTQYHDGLQVSDNQVIKPIGRRVHTDYGKFMGSTVSPDGRFLAATSTDKSVALQIFDLSTHRLVWRVGTAAGVDQKVSDLTVGQEGPTWSPDGKTLWLPQASQLTGFPVNRDGSLGTPSSVSLPTVGGKKALPGRGAYSRDGKTLYLPLNGQNTVVAIAPAKRSVEHTWNVGIAPREVTLVGKSLYVSDEGGRAARPGETTINSYGTDVPADGFLGTSTTGAVSVIDTKHHKAKVRSIDVGLHPTALYAHGSTLYVANTNSDTVSVISTKRNRVVQTIATQPYTGSSVGYEPTGITQVGHRLLVSLGRANAVAVYKVESNPIAPASYLGLLPTDYFPANVAAVGHSQIVVTNTRGIDARGPALTTNKGYGTTPATGHNTHSTTGSLTYFSLPSDRAVVKYTGVVFDQNGWDKHDVRTSTSAAHGHSHKKAVPVPKKIGDPSTIKHVFLIVRENRTYDQLLGDIGKGNSDPSLAQFGKAVTPNEHALSSQFGLLDNLYDIGTNSAEGHNWLMQGDDPEYTESSAGEYTRSYDTEDDVLGHQRSGFLWTSVMQAGGKVQNYGEFNQFLTKPTGADWQRYYCTAKSVEQGGDPAKLTDASVLSDTESPIPSLNAVTDHAFPKFDVNIPDIYRYEIWKQHFEKTGPANLNMFWLSSDHTGGAPDARAQAADNDLATGQIIDEISHSKYWKDSAIFVVEDDSQDGADHVDGHRAPVEVISPYAKRHAVIDTYYSQISVVRTIQQILGAQPLNQKLAAATPMFDVFTKHPNYKAYDAKANQIPLTENVATAPACGLDTPGDIPASSGTKAGAPSASSSPQPSASASAKASPSATAVPTSQKHHAAQWSAWQKKQLFARAKNPIEDSANPEQMSRFTWYQAHFFTTPYPGDSKIYAPNEVPGAYIPSADNDG